MKYSRETLLSIALLVSLILTVTATGALAQPSDEPRARYTVEFRNDCAGLDDCFDASDPVNVIDREDVEANTRQTATIVIAKNSVPADGTDFSFTSDLGDFTLDDADPDDGDAVSDSISLSAVPPLVDYAFVEQPPLSWILTSIVCGYSDIGTNVSPILDNGSLAGVLINPAADDEITCTFYNEQVPSSTIIIAKNAEPADGTDFFFTTDLGDFKLDDAVPDDGDLVSDQVTFSPVPASVDYAFVEQPPVFWDLSSIVCVYSGSSTISGIWDGEQLVGVTINPAADDEVTCTLYNVQVPLYPAYLPIVGKNYLSP